jgi:hypothetical protein
MATGRVRTVTSMIHPAQGGWDPSRHRGFLKTRSYVDGTKRGHPRPRIDAAGAGWRVGVAARPECLVCTTRSSSRGAPDSQDAEHARIRAAKTNQNGSKFRAKQNAREQKGERETRMPEGNAIQKRLQKPPFP